LPGRDASDVQGMLQDGASVAPAAESHIEEEEAEEGPGDSKRKKVKEGIASLFSKVTKKEQ